MSPPSYYLVNKTRKEFLCFDESVPLFTILKGVLVDYPAWKETDNIHVDSDLAGSTVVMEHYINVLAYRDLHAEESVVEQMEEAHQIFLCYIAAADEACRQYGHLINATGTEEELKYRILYKEARATQEFLRGRLPPV
jgi:hypothetical protein